ncbi:ABC transporter substrate-binding protein [Clavibacter phaseoli]|uniref:ABC transporter substrate-binding protein n=1 Tax=Clavibacter phaseoli TaxID=1734031 RepID=UPI000E66C0C6|nr:extracellular solute-binding protein [Clavibacter phaseoli]RIJ59815.1 extracellular solute-binding protein [Clavibacter phaseoli]
MTHSISRRQALGVGAAAAGTLALASCSAPGGRLVNSDPVIPAAAAGEKVTLTYWAWLKDLQKVADVWNAQNPDIQVEAVWIPGGNAGGYQKMYSAITAGGGPDIGQVELRQLPEFLLANGLVDLTRYGVEEYRDKYDEALWKQVSFQDGVFGIPQDSGPMAFYYQPALLDQVGGQPPATWDDWAAISAEVRKTGAGNYLDCFPVSDASVFTSYATQAGANWFKVDGERWVVDMVDDRTMEVAAFFDKAIDDDVVNTSFTAYSPPWYAAAADAKIFGCTSASWGDALIQSVSGGEGKWRVAPMQTWSFDGAYGSSYLGGSTAAVLANSQHPVEALKFMTWMTTSPEGIDAMIQNSGIGWSPSPDYIGAPREQPSEFFSGQSYNEEVFVPAAKEQNLDWTWCPLTQFTLNTLQDEFRRKLTSGQTLVESLPLAQEAVIEAFRNKGLRVEAASA